ncbi:hypothetical protein [Brevundimonas lenta]|uniref:Uncharacterized protein n=1 Tax=Brevundimonas lenta TaxID=424796 RepID=A0A7W6JEN0_9CAUL|nr:hypothetical protein [Brevundimonas lenta]MBB4083722.1 hypothetical protein [Brevundimonas lenta]
MTGWVFVIPVPVLLTYWGAMIYAARRLPAERRRVGDLRPVPQGLGSPGWWAIILFEKTDGFRPQTRRAFTVARWALFLLPIAMFAMMLLATLMSRSDGEAARERSAAPAVAATSV